MATKLKDNLSSAYFDAAHRLYPKKARRRIIAYVESYDDIAFWRALLAEFETDERYFQVMLPSATTLTKGKKQVLLNTLNTAELGRSLIACVDSDYDFLLQGSTPTSHKVNSNPYIFQTYAYAIENYRCYAPSLHDVCVQSTLNDRYVLNFEKFLERFSTIVYPLFLWSVWFYRNGDTHSFSITEFNNSIRLGHLTLKDPYRTLDELERRVIAHLARFEEQYPHLREKVINLARELSDLGLEPRTTYLYIQGHHLKDNVVMKLLTPICANLRKQRETEISRLAGHNKQYHNELKAYQNSMSSPEKALNKNTRYKGLFLYGWLRKDIENFLREK
ncbi:DUF4435 domain-containing protein [Bacteroides sp. OttesenSCG-928-E20]|nr:DUF4435 domain-containing protein [Bacteroides sp. OttesenSCG-928-N06]MDL2299348.1 DUF4435 domain-containing protein [Bacteroides sp. OttesenSCG-928-E20]MDL2304686.1 DUF4435 domain-containing protein [Bacteroides sp. OttesenSCG-928-D19]